MTGKITRLVKGKGFGFVRGEDNKEYFFHCSALENSANFDTLCEGQSVKFSPTQGNKGPRAEEVYIQ